jgi:long-chain fatty acid transport protein
LHLINSFIILPAIKNTLKLFLSDLTTNHKSLTSLKEVALRNFKQNLFGTIILSLLVVCIAVGGGYQINEQGARAVGMGGAFVANASDPSAVYYNPAGLTSQKGINLLLGGNLIIPSTTFKGPLPSTTETPTNSQVFTPINLYGTYQVNDQIVVGLGVFNPFGLGTEWPDLWGQAASGIYEGSRSSVKADVQTWYINPSVAYKVNDELSIGIGVSYVYGSVKLIKKGYLPLPAYVTATLDGTGSGYNVNVGILYRPIDEVTVGLSYRTTTKIDFSGDMKFTDVPATLTSFFPGGTGKATLPMPGTLQIGVAYKATEELTLEGDLQYIQWSEYDKLSLDVQPVVNLPPAYGGAQTQGPLTYPKNWVDNVILRGGAEYELDPQTTLRGGVILDLTPQPPSMTEPMLPDADRLDISIGGSYKINDKVSIDAAYMLLLFMERDAKTAALPGTYNSTAHIISVNVGYSF